MSLATTLNNLDGARNALVSAINTRGGSLSGAATLYDCAAAVTDLAESVQSVNGCFPDETGNVTIPDATQSASGLMSAADKAKLDEIAAVPSRPGYFKLPSGLLVQWGATADLSSDGETAVTLPLSFTREPLVVFATTTVSGIIASGLFNGLSEIRLYSSGYKSTPFKIYWLAIGK